MSNNSVTTKGLSLSSAKEAVARTVLSYGEQAPGLKMTFARQADGNYKPTHGCEAGFQAYRAAENTAGADKDIARLGLAKLVNDLMGNLKAAKRAAVSSADFIQVYKEANKWRVRATSNPALG